MTNKTRLQKLESAKPQTAQVIKTWREFIEADEETMKQFDVQAKAGGLPTWAEFIAENKPTAKP